MDKEVLTLLALALTLKKAKETKEPNAIKTGILQGSHYLT
jgi:hypothetical protein